MNPETETPQDWYFTFGANHTHPETGQRLGRSYVVIHGTCDSTRDAMFEAFGNRWSHQYIDAERAGVAEYDLIEVPMPGTFEEQVGGHLARLDAERTAPDEDPDLHGMPRTLQMLVDDLIDNAYGDGRDAEANADDAAISDDVSDLRDEILARWPALPEEQSGGAAALRADELMTDVRLAVATLRTFIVDAQPRGVVLAQLTRIEQLVRGEQQ